MRRRSSLRRGEAPIRSWGGVTVGVYTPRPTRASARPRLTRLLNHLIRSAEYRLRNSQSEGPGGLEIDHQLERGGLLDRQIAGLGAFEDLVYVCGGTTESIGVVGAIAEKSPRLGVLPCRGHHRQLVRDGELRETPTVGDEGRVHGEDDGVGARALHGREGGIEFRLASRVDALHHYPKGLRHALRVAHDELGGSVVWIIQDGDSSGPWEQLLEKLEALPGQVAAQRDHPGDVSARAGQARHESQPNGVGGRRNDD